MRFLDMLEAAIAVVGRGDLSRIEEMLLNVLGGLHEMPNDGFHRAVTALVHMALMNLVSPDGTQQEPGSAIVAFALVDLRIAKSMLDFHGQAEPRVTTDTLRYIRFVDPGTLDDVDRAKLEDLRRRLERADKPALETLAAMEEKLEALCKAHRRVPDVAYGFVEKAIEDTFRVMAMYAELGNRERFETARAAAESMLATLEKMMKGNRLFRECVADLEGRLAEAGGAPSAARWSRVCEMSRDGALRCIKNAKAVESFAPRIKLLITASSLVDTLERNLARTR